MQAHLCILSGVLTGLSFSNPRLSFLAWFSLVPFFACLKRMPLRAVTPTAVLFTLSYYGVAMYWINYVTSLGFCALLVYLCLFYVAFAWAAKALMKKPFPLLSLACLWVIIEFLKETVWPYCGWAQLGYSQFRNLYLIQTADLGGVKLISFLVVTVNLLFVEFLSYFRQRRKALAALALSFSFKTVYTALLLGLSALYAHYCFQKNAGYPQPARLSLLPPNTPEEYKYDYRRSPGIVHALS